MASEMNGVQEKSPWSEAELEMISSRHQALLVMTNEELVERAFLLAKREIMDSIELKSIVRILEKQGIIDINNPNSLADMVRALVNTNGM